MNINKMKKGYHEAHKRIRELEAKLEAADVDKANAVAEVQAKLDELTDWHAVATNESTNREFMIKMLEKDIAELNAEHSDAMARVEHMNSVQVETFAQANRELHAKLAEQAPTLEAAQTTIRDLQALLDKVRDKMSRKEQEKERAMLNRAALAGVIPEVNRGR